MEEIPRNIDVTKTQESYVGEGIMDNAIGRLGYFVLKSREKLVEYVYSSE
jgi:hypothetical protein